MPNGSPAGPGTLFNLQPLFTADLNVASPGQITLTVSSDDGFVLGIGPQGTNQPTRISGTTMVNPPVSSFVKLYPVMGALNQGTAPVPNDMTINFPVAGTYPLELDYTECCGGYLSPTLGFNGTLVPPPPPPPPTTPTPTPRNLSPHFTHPSPPSPTP